MDAHSDIAQTDVEWGGTFMCCLAEMEASTLHVQTSSHSSPYLVECLSLNLVESVLMSSHRG